MNPANKCWAHTNNISTLPNVSFGEKTLPRVCIHANRSQNMQARARNNKAALFSLTCYFNIDIDYIQESQLSVKWKCKLFLWVVSRVVLLRAEPLN